MGYDRKNRELKAQIAERDKQAEVVEVVPVPAAKSFKPWSDVKKKTIVEVDKPKKRR